MNLRHVAAAVVAVTLSAVANAAADPAADLCGGTKTKSAARYAKSLFGCYASALRHAEPVDPACTAKAAGRLSSAFDKADAAGGCVTADDEAAAMAVVDSARAAVDAVLAPAPEEDALACAGTKLKAAGRHVGARLACFGNAAVRSDGPGAECLAMADDRLVSGFTKAEIRGGCTTTGDFDAIRATDDTAVRELVQALSPVCGDAILGPSQVCESPEDAACPGLCSAACVCVLPPECGDGVAQLPEECDDGGLADGDGCSASCQLEQASALCTGVPAAAGTAIDAIFVSNAFTAPMFVAAPRLDPGRLFVVERAGIVRILDLLDDTVKPAPFLDISDLTTTGGERGFFSMAFDPDYETNRRFYVSYTNLEGDLVLARYEADATDPDVADESTRRELVVVPHPGASNHNGGQVQFGGDGYLYWSIGEGGGDAQDETTLIGKLLRLDVGHDSAPYVSVPPTNPGYAGGAADIEYLWAKGLRNPWRFSFDRQTGDLYIGDVGAGDREEIDFAPAASTGSENYGWPIFEGTTCQNGPCPDPPTGFTFPIYEYPHGRPCAVMGGYVYRGCAMPDLAGTYFFSDMCAAFVRTFEVVGGEAVNVTDRTSDAKSAGASLAAVISWGEDARGELYLVLGNNSIYRIEPE